MPIGLIIVRSLIILRSKSSTVRSQDPSGIGNPLASHAFSSNCLASVSDNSGAEKATVLITRMIARPSRVLFIPTSLQTNQSKIGLLVINKLLVSSSAGEEAGDPCGRLSYAWQY